MFADLGHFNVQAIQVSKLVFFYQNKNIYSGIRFLLQLQLN